MSNSGRISSTEIRDLFISLIALVIAFSILGERRLPGYEMVLISAVGVSTGFLLHEMAHKFIAMHYGYWAEYRANLNGLILAVIMAFAGFLFAAPGAVMITRTSPPQGFNPEDPVSQERLMKQAKTEELWISLSGPLTNVLLAIFFFLLLESGVASKGLWSQAASFAFFINITLAAFNLLPVGPLDGKKVFDNNRLIWTIVALPTILVALPIYFNMI